MVDRWTLGYWPPQGFPWPRGQSTLVTRPSRSDWLSGVRSLQFATEPDSLLRVWALCCPLPTADEAGSAGAHPEATAPAQLWSAFSSLAAGWVPGERHRARRFGLMRPGLLPDGDRQLLPLLRLPSLCRWAHRPEPSWATFPMRGSRVAGLGLSGGLWHSSAYLSPTTLDLGHQET